MTQTQNDLIFDRLLWLPNDHGPLRSRIHSELTVHAEQAIGPTKTYECWEESDEWLGVPRAWGIKQQWLLQGRKVLDRTVCPHIQWPQFDGKYRKGQADAVNAMLKAYQDGSYGELLEARTGTGKTVMATAIASHLNTPTLVIVHKDDLAEQWQMLMTGGIKSGKRVEPMFPGGSCGHVQGDKWDYQGHHMVTAMAQTLYARRGKEPAGFYDHFGLVIIDEGHRYPAKTFEKVLRLPQAKRRLAVSATWRRRDGLECVWHWHVGSVGHRVKATQMTGKYVQVPWNTSITDQMFRRGKFFNTAALQTAIANNPPYNQWLAEQMVEGAAVGRKMLLVSHRTAQLLDIRKRLQSIGPNLTVGYYAGTVDGKKIKKDELEATKLCQIILATYSKMSEGTDIPTLDTLYLGTPAGDIEQVVGRIQRLEAGKRWLLVVDPVWQTQYNIALSKKRANTLRTLGFTRQGD